MKTKTQYLQEWAPTTSQLLPDKSLLSHEDNYKRFSGTPLFYAFVDMDYYCLTAPISWIPEGCERAIVNVPKGFVTDFASVPRLFWSVLPPIGRYGYAAVFHDFAYWEQLTTREEADLNFRKAMRELNVWPPHREAMYMALRMFGALAWRKNAELKKKGERRVLSKLPEDILISWAEWKQRPDVFE